jgi:hypothetical protein
VPPLVSNSPQGVGMRKVLVETDEVQLVFSGLHKIPEFSGTHYWVVVSAYHVLPEKLGKEGPSFLDLENLVSFQGPFCFYCQQGYDELSAKRRCNGQ